MWQKIYFTSIVLFFLIMNVLLWRSEFGNADFTVPVPVDSVIRRVLEAADDSSLEIRHHGKKIGFCRWAVTLMEGRRPVGDPLYNEPIEGMVPEVLGYGIDFDGNLMLGNMNRFRFNYSLVINTNQQWDAMHLRLNLRPLKWEIHSAATNETIQITFTDDHRVVEQNYRFGELKNPLRLLRDFAGPLGFDPFTSLGLTLPALPASPAQFGLQWEAWTDHQKIGNSQVPVYRVEAPLLDKYRIRIFIQKSGEILRVELPDEIVLINDKLITL